jgi:hypothetical protein
MMEIERKRRWTGITVAEKKSTGIGGVASVGFFCFRRESAFDAAAGLWDGGCPFISMDVTYAAAHLLLSFFLLGSLFFSPLLLRRSLSQWTRSISVLMTCFKAYACLAGPLG